MKTFLYKSILFSLLVGIGIFGLCSMADGYTDPFYMRFTSPVQQNLILGSSRAAQGILPQVLNKELGQPFYNYSFTLLHSPYGPVYYNSIKKKLDSNSKDGIYIVTVDPWSISSKAKNPNDSSQFRENNLCLGNTQQVSMKPNIPYLFNNLNGKFHTLLFPNNKTSYLHKNGWLEVTVPMDSASMQKRLKAKLEFYRKNNLHVFNYSDLRYRYLEKTIKLLKSHGRVYLVRLPVQEEMLQIEREQLPDFDERMQKLAKLSDAYLDMTTQKKKYTFTDGNHLYKSSGLLASQSICTWIKKNKIIN